MNRIPVLALATASLLSACGTSTSNPAVPHPGSDGIDFYADPPMAVSQILVDEGAQGNPKEIRFFVPEQPGSYPLLQFQHGFTSDVDSYTDLLARLAGFGFIVAGPQMYVGDPSTAPTVAAETADAVEALAWVQANVNAVIAGEFPALAVTALPEDTGLLGHSRGGQVAWRMLFDHPGTNARAIGGVDPVDGDAPPFPPGETGEMVTDDPGAFSFPFASLIIGMSLGSSGAPGFECAPENRNYTFFYDASAAPRYEVTAVGYGHSDMLNGDNPEAVCPGDTAGTRNELRAFVAGQLAAYFTSVLKGGDEFGWLRDVSDAPVPAEGRYED